MNKTQIVQLLTPVLTPLLVAGFKWLWPHIPKPVLPVFCPIFGALIDLATSQQLGPGTAWGAALGTAGIGLREIYDQTLGDEAKKRKDVPAVPPTTTPTVTKP